MDPENGIFRILGVSGFIDMRHLTFLKNEFTQCEIINE